jgi:hypothetical protein
MNRLLRTIALSMLTIFASCTSDKEKQPVAVKSQNSTVAQSPCSHPYFPVRENGRWEYRINYSSGPEKAVTYVETRSPVDKSSFANQLQFDNDVKTEFKWKCTDEGLVSPEFGRVAYNKEKSGFRLETVKSTGVTIPAPDKWKQGHQWDAEYEVKGHKIQDGSPLTMDVAGRVKVSNVITGREKIKVLAGEFEAVRVESTMTENLEISINKMKMPANLTFKSTNWFAENVGLVKTEMKDSLISATTELVSQK